MDNLDSSNPGNKNPEEPISPNENADEPIPFDDPDNTSVSHSPLDLGGGGVELPNVEVAAKADKPVAKRLAEEVISSDRITGVKTFFTKLHAGALEFLDEQITNWLNKNPGIEIKRTNTVTGSVAGKKTEPNIIVTIWY